MIRESRYFEIGENSRLEELTQVIYNFVRQLSRITLGKNIYLDNYNVK